MPSSTSASSKTLTNSGLDIGSGKSITATSTTTPSLMAQMDQCQEMAISMEKIVVALMLVFHVVPYHVVTEEDV